MGRGQRGLRLRGGVVTVGPYRFSPCNRCCEPPPECGYFEDLFDREDSGDLGANWAETAGSWSIAGEKLVTSSSDAEVTCQVEHPNSRVEYSAQVRVYPSAKGDVMRLAVDGGAVVVEIVAGSVGKKSYISLWQGETCRGVRDHYPNTGDGHVVTVCVGNGRVSVGNIMSIPYTATSSVVSLQTGAVAGEVAFDGFALQYHGNDRAGCPTCQPQCMYVLDDFTWDDGDPPPHWTEVSGDWSISGNTLAVASGGIAIVAAKHSLPIAVTANVSECDDDANPGVVFNYVDDENYWYAWYDGDGGKCYIVQVAGGAPTTRDMGDSGKPWVIRVCYSGRLVSAYFLKLDGTFAGNALSYPATFTSPVVGVISLSGSEALFTAVSVSKQPDGTAEREDCDNCMGVFGCLACVDAESPGSFLVEIDGLPRCTLDQCGLEFQPWCYNGDQCDTCWDDLNGAWVCDQTTGEDQSYSCGWQSVTVQVCRENCLANDPDGMMGCSVKVEVFRFVGPPATYQLRVTLVDQASWHAVSWTTDTFDDPIECMTLTDYEMPSFTFNAVSSYPYTETCDPSPATVTCRITKL